MTYPNPPAPPPAPPAQSMGSSNTMFVKEIRLDPTYLKTPGGVLKMVVILLNILGLICIISSPFRSHGKGIFFSVVGHLGLWFSSAMLAMYLFHIVERYHNIKWLLIEIVAYAVETFLYLIVSTIAVAFGDAGYSAAGFFGYLAMVAYGADFAIKFKARRAGDLPQGQRVLSKQQHIVTPTTVP